MADQRYRDPDVLEELYVNQGLTQQEIGNKLGVSDSTISNWIRRHEIEKEDPPWRDEDTLRELYWDEEMSISEVADRLDTHVDVIHRWMVNLDIDRRKGPNDHYPWHDEELLRELYFEKGLSQTDIAERLGTVQCVIGDWFKRHGIETLSYAEAGQQARRVDRCYFHTDTHGYEKAGARCGEETFEIQIHRLVAIAKHGFDAVNGDVVHHRNEIKWDNRPANLRVMSDSGHKSHHATTRGEKPPEGF